MFLKLTNAASDFKDKALIINFDNVVEYHEQLLDSDTEIRTTIYSTTKDFWQVKETIEEVNNLLNVTTS